MAVPWLLLQPEAALPQAHPVLHHQGPHHCPGDEDAWQLKQGAVPSTQTSSVGMLFSFLLRLRVLVRGVRWFCLIS